MKGQMLNKNFTYFTNRQERAGFIAQSFQKEIEQSKKILDVGCDYNSLKKIVGNKVTGVDLYGEPDIRIDFEKDRLSAFKAGSFDLVVCTEVLEHLDNLHEMLDELFRVSNRYVLISLPNCLSLFAKWSIVFRGEIGKFYGLPFTKPEDRHRWLFSYKDLDRFFEHYCRTHKYKIREKFLEMSFSNSWRGQLMRLLIKALSLNSAARSYWILIEKPSPKAKKPGL